MKVTRLDISRGTETYSGNKYVPPRGGGFLQIDTKKLHKSLGKIYGSGYTQEEVTYEPSDAVVNPRIWQFRKTISTPEFFALRAQGSIVMNDYEVGRFIQTPIPKTELISSNIVGAIPFTPEYWRDHQIGFTELITGFDKNWFGFSEKLCFVSPGIDPFVPGFNSPGVPRIQDTYRVTNPRFFNIEKDFSNTEMDPILIQNVLADANDGDVDALTALLEASETAESVVSGIKLLWEALKAFRKKEIVLTSRASERAKSRARAEFFRKRKFPSKNTFKRRFREQKNGRWSGDHRNPNLFISEKELDAEYEKMKSEFLRKNKDEYDSYTLYRSKNLTKSELKELGDAITSVWMNYRYNIKPTVSLIEDSLKAMDNFRAIYRTYRGKKETKVPITSPSGSIINNAATRTDRVTIKRRYTYGSIGSDIAAALGFDVFVSALERVPIWGIVINWFFSAATYLRSLDWNPKYAESKTSYSIKYEIDGEFLDTPTNLGSARMLIRGSSYHRKVIHPADYRAIYLNVQLGLYRQLDAAAFTWNAFHKNLKTHSIR